MPFWRRVRDRARDLAQRVRSSVARSTASSLSGVGRRLSRAGEDLLASIPPEPSMGARHGPLRNSREQAEAGENVSEGSGASSCSLRRDNPRANYRGPIQTNPDAAWGGRPNTSRARDRTFTVRTHTPEASTSRSRGVIHGDAFVAGYHAGREEERRQERRAHTDAYGGDAAAGLSQFMESTRLSQYHSATSQPSWYDAPTQGSSWYNSAQRSQAGQGVSWGEADNEESSSSEEGPNYENVTTGVSCPSCGANLVVTLLSLTDSISQYADFFVSR